MHARTTNPKKDVNNEKVVNDSLVSAGEDAGIIEQGVEGKVQIEVALDDRFFHWKRNKVFKLRYIAFKIISTQNLTLPRVHAP